MGNQERAQQLFERIFRRFPAAEGEPAKAVIRFDREYMSIAVRDDQGEVHATKWGRKDGAAFLQAVTALALELGIPED